MSEDPSNNPVIQQITLPNGDVKIVFADGTFKLLPPVRPPKVLDRFFLEHQIPPEDLVEIRKTRPIRAGDMIRIDPEYFEQQSARRGITSLENRYSRSITSEANHIYMVTGVINPDTDIAELELVAVRVNPHENRLEPAESSRVRHELLAIDPFATILDPTPIMTRFPTISDTFVRPPQRPTEGYLQSFTRPNRPDK